MGMLNCKSIVSILGEMLSFAKWGGEWGVGSGEWGVGGKGKGERGKGIPGLFYELLFGGGAEIFFSTFQDFFQELFQELFQDSLQDFFQGLFQDFLQELFDVPPFPLPLSPFP